ncbi:MAG: sterol desaturase family protein [Phycisphaerae bacterium]|nr:sterol desaturase family protein [Phycisphaerae bacterium]
MAKWKLAITAAVFIVLWVGERFAPTAEGRVGRLPHAARNLCLGLLNAAVVTLAFGSGALYVTEAAREANLGLLHWLNWPWLAECVVAVVVFDAWQYLWHRLNHRVPFLWRFHAVHHSDGDMDASTALRFHTGEIVFSSIARLAVLPILGMQLVQVLIYELILQPIILFHHSNVRVPRRVDRALRVVLVTPWMHWVHHSNYRPETDSNYSSVFSFWDRLFGSYGVQKAPWEVNLGLVQYEKTVWWSLRGMLLIPFRPVRRPGR